MRKQKIQFIVLAVILIVCIGGYFGITSYYKNKESNEKEASTIKVLEIENYKDLTKVSYNYEDATINLVKKDDKWKDESDTSKNLDSNNINSEMLSTLVEIDASTKIDSPKDISQYGFTKDSDGNITGETNSITVTDNDGKVNKIQGILPMCIEAKKCRIKTIIVPKENEKEAMIIEGLKIIPVATLKEVIEYINQNKEPKKERRKFDFQKIDCKRYNIDFSDVKGQENAKRALEIAAAGRHNCILTGSPGGGKTMLAKRLPTILPDLSFEEALEITKIHSIAGILKSETGIITTRPFRTPHHTISTTSMVGGGRIPKPRRNKFSTLWSIIFR